MLPNTDLVPFLEQFGWTPCGRLKARTAKEIGISPWSIGLETIDRDYVKFAPLVPHLGELGATQARLQAGWARCEPEPNGEFQWDWLDEVVDGCLSQGVEPWLQTSYGNPGYPGGGGIGLGEGIPVSEEALAAWDRWIRAMAIHYKGRVNTWEVWNEPLDRIVSVEAYTRFFIRTARILREVQPDAAIVAPGLAHLDELDFIGKFLAALAEEKQAYLLNEISYHFYPHNPDEQFDCVDELQRLCQRYASHVTLRQGETGAPSECIRFMAMGEFDWSERKQAVWNARRLLAHHARGIPMNLFQLADMHYVKEDGALHEGRNPKGQLCIAPDMSVAYRKPSYFAAQHIFSVFDDRFPLQKTEPWPGRYNTRTSAYRWSRRGEEGTSLLAWWKADQAPGLTTPELDKTGMEPQSFEQPVLVDFLSGVVFAAPEGIASCERAAWQRMPWAESPLALAEKQTLQLKSL